MAGSKRSQEFLQLTASVTNAQIGSSYLSLSVLLLVFQSLIKSRICVISSRTEFLLPVAETLPKMLCEYESFLSADVLLVVSFLDLLFPSNVLEENVSFVRFMNMQLYCSITLHETWLVKTIVWLVWIFCVSPFPMNSLFFPTIQMRLLSISKRIL